MAIRWSRRALPAAPVRQGSLVAGALPGMAVSHRQESVVVMLRGLSHSSHGGLATGPGSRAVGAV